MPVFVLLAFVVSDLKKKLPQADKVFARVFLVLLYRRLKLRNYIEVW